MTFRSCDALVLGKDQGQGDGVLFIRKLSHRMCRQLLGERESQH